MVKIFQKSALLLAKIFHCEFDMIFLFIPQYIRNSHHLRFITSVIEGVGKFNKILYGYPFFFDVKTTFQQVLKTSKRIDHMRFDWKNKLATCLDQFKNRKLSSFKNLLFLNLPNTPRLNTNNSKLIPRITF